MFCLVCVVAQEGHLNFKLGLEEGVARNISIQNHNKSVLATAIYIDVCIDAKLIVDSM